ncbi:RLA class II histocompatibility antigen, DP alpha-1 chain-like isoform X3 [Octodon degus]|uniref:RLA class II histocompatibility antigen, DP alpha-1 chain-like isoform X3 n=1 Tax=Octodon degus TaxID=10160 RepID=A0A6P6EX30_OCTDE|nr:RLA class II histocompatibility antigen, DP alpha-1 chain-like isoform X3 [Octodon degus]
MFQNKAAILSTLPLAFLLGLQGAGAIGDHVAIFTCFAQTRSPSGELMVEIDGDELLYVDMDKKAPVWRLPEFGRAITVDVEPWIPMIGIMKMNLNTLIKRSNHTQAPSDPPEVTVFPKEPVELGKLNILICHVDRFFPPVLNVTWLKNGQPVTEGVSESVFLPRTDYHFHQFHYLTFLPSTEDVYDCKVEHWGLDEPYLTHWEPQEPNQVMETTETLVCALGLLVVLVGITVGPVIIIRALCSSRVPQTQGPL